MKFIPCFPLLAAAAFAVLPPAVASDAPSSRYSSLVGDTFDLGRLPAAGTHDYLLETRVTNLAPDGTRGATDTYRLRLRRAREDGEGLAGTVTCVSFHLRLGEGAETEITALRGLGYRVEGSLGGEGRGPVLGVPHAPFERLVDAEGRAIPPGNTYHVYNAFIDFHGFCDVFTHPMGEDAGIEDLRTPGQEIIHATAGSEVPVNLGGNVRAGSFFRNGEVTLKFKGLGVAEGAVCGLLGMDSGRSAFAMIMEPVPGIEVRTTGGSRYRADLWLGLADGWVHRVEAHEIVVSETRLPGPPEKIATVTERLITIRRLAEERASPGTAGE